MKMIFAPVCEASLQQFRPAAFTVRLSGSNASIFVRKALRVRPRDRATAAYRLRKLAGKDLRFSMKMMLTPVYGVSLQPV
jgi:hypothetical protein